MIAQQITIEGELVAHPVPTPAPLSGSQRAILRTIRALGELRSSEAGLMMHGARGWCAPFHAPYAPTPDRLGCCEYGATDGAAAMRRLERRGLVERVGRGRWVPR